MPRWAWIVILILLLVIAPVDVATGAAHLAHGITTFIHALGLH